MKEACDESMTGNGSDYRGCQTITRNNYRCQWWSAQIPHKHGMLKLLKKLDPNDYYGQYCRNPDNSKTIWCYTDKKERRWDYCDPRPTGGL